MTSLPIPMPASRSSELLEEEQKYFLENRDQAPWVTAKDLSFNSKGGVIVGAPDLGFFEQVGNRIAQRALQGMDIESHWSDYVTQDLFSLAADKRNDANRQAMQLYTVQGQLVFDAEQDEWLRLDEVGGVDVPRLLSSGVKKVLEGRGYDFSFFEGLSFEEATNRLSRDILSISLDDTLTRSANTALERAAGGTLSFVSGFVDVASVFSAGTAGAAKALGSSALKASAREGASPLIKVAANTASRFGRNGTISGSLIDSRYTIEHASSFLGVDAMVMAGGIDLLSQYRENAILDMYYENPESTWFDPARFAASSTMGWLLGKGMGKLFGIDNSLAARQDFIDKAVSHMTGPDASAEAKEAATLIVNGFWDDLKVPNFGEGKRTVEDVVDDMLDDYLTIYDGDIVDGMTRSTQLKALIVETISNAGADVRGTKVEWNNANARVVKATDDIRTLELQKTRVMGNLRGVVSPDGSRVPTNNPETRALHDELFEEWSEMLQDINTRMDKSQRDLHQAREEIRRLTDRENLAARANAETRRQNAAVEILEFLKKSPSAKELQEFLEVRNIKPTQRAQQLQNELNRLAEVEAVAAKASQLTDSVDDIELRLKVAKAAQEAAAIKNRIPIYTQGKSGTAASTKFEEAMAFKNSARQLFRKAENTKDLKLREAALRRAVTDIDSANSLLDQVAEEAVRGVADRQSRGGQFETYLESNKVVPVSKKSQADARRFLEAHYFKYGSPPQIRNKTWLNRLLYSNTANNIAGWGTPRAVMEQMIEGSPEMSALVHLIADISHVHRSFDSSSTFVEPIDIMRMRYNRLSDRKILKPVQKLAKQYRDSAQFNNKLKDAYRVAAGLDSSNDPLVNEVAKGMAEVYRKVELEAIKQGMLRPGKDGEPYIHVQAMPGMADDPTAVDTLIDVYYNYLRNKHDPSRFRTDPTRRSVLSKIGVIAEKKKRSAGTEENVWAMNNLLVREGEEVKVEIDGKEITFTAGAVNRDFDTFEVDTFFTRENLSKLQYMDSDGNVRGLDELYLENFDIAMKEEADSAVQNLVAVSGPAEYSKGVTGGPTDSKGKARRINASNQRKIPMEVVLDRRVLDTGLINLNPLLDSQHYWFSFGYDVYESRQLNKLLGARGKYGRTGQSELTSDNLATGVDFETFVDFALSVHKQKVRKSDGTQKFTDKHYEDMARFILQTRDSLSGRNFIAHEQDSFTTGILQFISQIASVGVHANVALMMPLTEIAMPATLHLLGKGNKGVRMKAMMQSFGDLSKKQQRAMGKSLEQATLQQRVMADSGYYTDEVVLTFAQRFAAPFKRLGRAARGEGTARSFRAATEGRTGRIANTMVAGAEVLAETTRNLSSELIQTEFAHGIFGRFHVNMIQTQTTNIRRAQMELMQLVGQPIDEKVLKGVARRAGLDFTDMQDMIQRGILNYDAAPIGIDYLVDLAKNVDNFGDPDKVYRYLNSLEGETKARTTEMYERVLDYATTKVDRDVTNPGVFDRPMHAANPLNATVHRFLSFSRGFRSGKMQELANAGIASAATGYIGYTLAEMANRSLISVWSHGESWQELGEKWEREPERMAIYALGGVPYLGGGQSFANEVIGMFTGDRFAPSYSPTLSIFGSNVRTIQKMFDPEQEPTEQDYRRAFKLIPFANNAAAAPLLNMALDEDTE